jgi:hypothetical protein
MSKLRAAAEVVSIVAVLGACSEPPPPPVGGCCGYAVEVIVPQGACGTPTPDGGRVDAGCALAGMPVRGDACTESVRVAIQCQFSPLTCNGSPGELWCGAETDQGTAQAAALSLLPLLDAGWPLASAQGNCNCIIN